MLYTLGSLAILVLLIMVGVKISYQPVKYLLWGLAVCGIIIWLVVGFGLWSTAETTAYTVVEKKDALELRRYPSVLMASTTVSGPQDQTMRQGFGVLASYIFGGNDAEEKIPMTTPVLQFGVQLETHESGGNTLAFVLPKDREWSHYPKPKDSKVRLEVLHEASYWVYQWRGDFDQAHITKAFETIQAQCKAAKQRCLESAIHAAYSPPWVFPWRHLHELWVIVE